MEDPIAYAKRVFPTDCDACKEKMGENYCEETTRCEIKKRRAEQ